MGTAIRGVLFDSGDTVIRPVGGRWNPRHDFESIVLRHHPAVAQSAFPAAFEAGQRVLDAGTTTSSLAEYHTAILQALGVPRPTADLLAELEAPSDRPPVEAFPEARAVLDRLREMGIRMSVVSDSWAGLDHLYQRLGLDGYFEAFVISEVMGCRKPDPRMYRAGSEALGLPEYQCIFIDDDPELVSAAIDLGYHGVVIARGARPPTAVPVISSLRDLIPIIEGHGHV